MSDGVLDGKKIYKILIDLYAQQNNLNIDYEIIESEDTKAIESA